MPYETQALVVTDTSLIFLEFRATGGLIKVTKLTTLGGQHGFHKSGLVSHVKHGVSSFLNSIAKSQHRWPMWLL